MIGALFLLGIGLVMGIKMTVDAANTENPGMGFLGMLITMFTGGSLLLWLFLFAIGVR